MALIRKRLKVEMWMFDQLQELQDLEVSWNIEDNLLELSKQFQNEMSMEVDIDLDEILDIEDEIQRKIFVQVSKS